MKMNSRVVLLLVFISVAALILPSVSAGGHYCKECPLQSPAACNMSSPEERCSKNPDTCYALTAQLMNGTLVSTRGCYEEGGSCNNTVCEQVQNATGIAFKHCIADCCITSRCNAMVPEADFKSTPTPSLSPSVPVASSSSIGGTEAPDKPSTPTSSSTMKKGLRYLLVLLPSVIFILN